MLSEKVTAMERAIGSYLSPGKYSAHRKLESQYVTILLFRLKAFQRIGRLLAGLWAGVQSVWRSQAARLVQNIVAKLGQRTSRGPCRSGYQFGPVALLW